MSRVWEEGAGVAEPAVEARDLRLRGVVPKGRVREVRDLDLVGLQRVMVKGHSAILEAGRAARLLSEVEVWEEGVDLEGVGEGSSMEARLRFPVIVGGWRGIGRGSEEEEVRLVDEKRVKDSMR